MAVQTVFHEVDFCVVGGGLAGLCAAVAAAREGCRVALVQDRPMLGGNASSEIRMWIGGAEGSNNRETGIIEEIELMSLWRNPDKNYSVWDGILWETVKKEKNITLLLNCSVFDAETQDGSIVSVTGWQTTTQLRHTVKAALFADCSGDSVLAPLTGAAFRIGREAAETYGEKTSQETADSKTMGMSCLIQLRKTQRPSVFIPPDWATPLPEEVLRFRMPDLSSPGENFWYLELGGNRDPIRDTEAVRDELLGLAYGMVDFIKNSGRFEDADFWELDWMGFLPGKRESRRMCGAYTVTQNDILAGGRFPDVVAYGGWGLDDHHPDGFYHRGNPNVWGKTPSPYGIPYRCLYSENIPNLFFAGRNISMTHAAMSSARVMATCALVGQAVGTAAGIAAAFSLSPRGVYEEKLDLLQQKLMENGCFLPYVRRRIAPVCLEAALSFTGKPPENPEDLRSGCSRNNALYGPRDRRVALTTGEAATYTFLQPVQLQNVHLQFDTDLDRTTLPGGKIDRQRSMRANRTPESPAACLPQTLVRAYRVTAETADGRRLTVADCARNLKGCVNLPMPDEPVTSVSFVPLSTWGPETETVKIFSFDVR